jgi:hypothetical protein
MRWLPLLLLCALAGDAAAKPTGISGASGKSGFFCNKCHSGGATPTVTLSGPAMLQPGASATYTFTISGGAAVAGGLDAALDDAALAAGASLATVSPLTKLLNGEVTHSQPNDFTAGALTFQFAVKAPPSASTMTLFVAGNSTNHNGNNSGDRAAATTMTITVGSPPPPPPPPPADFAGAPPGSDLAQLPATDQGAAASDLAIGPSPSGPDLTTPAGDSGSAGPPAGDPSSGDRSRSGCSTVPGAVGDDGAALGWIVALALAGLGVAGARLSRRAPGRCAPPAPPASSGSASARVRR